MTIALTRALGKFIAGLRYRDIPKEAVSFIHTAFADTVGVTIAGASEPAPQLLKSMLAPAGGEATLLVGQGRASALDAAWINGTAAHALDFDDTAQRGAHPSAVLVPAILAEAEAIGASGEQMVLAYAVGYETFSELAWRDTERSIGRGWNTSGVLGAIGAAAACASLRGLDAGKSTIAVALGASQSSGLLSNHGTMAKPFHAGRAAHAGVTSARLADAGFTAAPDALEQPPGFLTVVTFGGKIDIDAPVKAGVRWQICDDNRLAVKKYPLCYGTHRALDGILDLLHTNKVDPGEVECVTVTVSSRMAAILRYHLPQNCLEAKFSLEFAIASALIAGRAGLVELTEDFVLRPDVQALMKRVVVKTNDSSDSKPQGDVPNRIGYAQYDQVVVETCNGRRLKSRQVTSVRGDADLPLRPDELWSKFESCLQAGNARIPAKKLYDALMSLDQLPHVRELIRLLT